MLRERLLAEAAAACTAAEWEARLRAAARLPGESFANVLLIEAQRPGATMLKGYEEWRAAGRQVNRGEPGIEVFSVARSHPRKDAQRSRGTRQPDAPASWREASRAAYVWDIAQTSGPAAASPVPGAPGEVPAGMPDALCWLARREGFAVETEQGAPADGVTFWTPRRIRLLPGLDPAQEAWALAHQLGHVLAHGAAPHPPGSTTSGDACAGIRKAEADAIAFITCARYGIPAPRPGSPGTWAGTDPRARPALTVLAAGELAVGAAARITSHLAHAMPNLSPAPVAAEPARAPATRTQPGAVGRTPPVPRPTAPAPRIIQHPDQAMPHARHSQAAEQVKTPAPGPQSAAAARTGPGMPPVAPEAAPGPRLLAVLSDAATFYSERIAGNWAAGYLRSRGIEPGTAAEWHIGYAPAGWTTLTDSLLAAGYAEGEIEAAGLARRSSRGTLIDHFRDRVILPVRDPGGQVTGFIGRGQPGADAPKYFNSPQTSLYSKGDLLFGLHESRSALRDGAIPVIVEGPFDAIAVTAAGAGRFAGLAPCGTALTSSQAALLARSCDLPRSGVLAAFDDDGAGRKAATRAYGILRPFTPALRAPALAGRDPAQIFQEQGPLALRGALTDGTAPLLGIVVDADLARWERRLGETEGPLLAMRSAAGVLATLLPADTAARVRHTAGDARLIAQDDEMRPVVSPQLPQVAEALPADTASQVIRLADRLGFTADEVVIEIANAVPRQASEPDTQRRQAAASLAVASFPVPPATSPAQGEPEGQPRPPEARRLRPPGPRK